MAFGKVYRAVWVIDDTDTVVGDDHVLKADAEQDITDAEAAAGSYTSFMGTVEELWIGP